MGGTRFIVTADGEDAERAFRTARTSAQFVHGHGGYTGTIAEKSEVVMFDVPAGAGLEPSRLAAWILDNSPDDLDAIAFVPADQREPLRRIMETAEDKWGPACGFQAGPTSFVFFGWASS